MNRLYSIAAWIGAALCLPATAWPQAPEITVELSGGVPLEMVWIEPGTFLMGGEPDLVEDTDLHGPQHTVTLSKGFYLGKFELTQAQWTAVMGTKPWEERGEEDCPNCPATAVSWEDAQDFFQQLKGQLTDSLLYRLPTEAEWEYAARAGTQTAWSFGDDSAELEKYGWYREITCLDDMNDYSECFLHEVGLKLPNPWGLYDVHGNVAEWVEDWWEGHYSKEPQTDPLNDVISTTNPIAERVIRGGAYPILASNTRAGFRSSQPPGEKWNDIGFRVAASLRTKKTVIQHSWGSIKTKSAIESARQN